MARGENAQRRAQMLVLVMMLLVLGSTGITVYLLYCAGFDSQARWLTQIAESQARFIETVSATNGGDRGNALSVAKEANAAYAYHGFGESGALQLVRRDTGGFFIMLSNQKSRSEFGGAIKSGSSATRLFRRAIDGPPGIFTGMDERSIPVLAAVHPVANLGWGVIAKMDLAEIRQPFIRATGLAMLIAMLGIAFGAAVIQRINNRLIGALARSKDFSERLLENLVEPAFVLDCNHRVVLWNRACAELTGLRPAAVLGTRDHWRGFYTAPRACLADAVISPGLASDPAWVNLRSSPFVAGGLKAENWCDLHGGGRRWLSIDAAPIHDADGQLIAVIETLRDLTEERRLQEELLSARDAALVGSRAKSQFLANMSHEIRTPMNGVIGSRAKSQFLANMSHEIRTPMNGVIGMLELLKNTPLGGQQRDLANTAHGSAEVLLEIINDILDISKIEAGRLELEDIEMNVRDVLEDLASLLSKRAHDKHLELTCLVPLDMPTAVRGDPTRLKQILLNLLGNAIKFTHRGEVSLRVALLSQTDTRVRFRFSVTDTGIGIDPQAMGRLFQSFSQADGLTTRQFGGTGLGLAISKQLAEMMGGEIGVESVPGRGSTFWFTAEMQRCAAPAQTSANSDLRGRRVLLVDDSRVNRQILEQLMESWGAAYESAESGVLALVALRAAARAAQPFDTAILDMQMPGMNGLELSAQMQRDPVLANTTRVLLTSVDQVSIEARQQAGIDAMLYKPVRPQILIEQLGRSVRRTEVSASSSAPVLMEFVARRVLLVEDNAVNQLVACGLLEQFGLQPDIAGNGREAVDMTASREYDLVFMDCQMPELDGFDATKSIRERERNTGMAPVTIVAMTANAMEGDRDRCLAAGMNDYVSKPVRLEHVERVLRRWLCQDNDINAAA